MPNDKIDIAKSQIEMNSVIKHSLDTYSSPDIRRPIDTAILTNLTKALSLISSLRAEMRRQSLLSAEICRQQQLQAALPKTALSLMKAVTDAERISARTYEKWHNKLFSRSK